MNHRATIALALATLACFAVLTYNSGEDVLAAETVHVSAAAQARGKKDDSVMKAIVDLKAYCMGARDGAQTMKNKGKTSSLVPFIIKFGKKDVHADLVTQYAKIVGKLRARYTTGLGAYLLDRMNEAVLTGKKVTELGSRGLLRNRAMLDYRRLGLQARPIYFKKLNVRLSHWSSARAAIHEGKSGDAIKAWVKSGNAEVFKMFLNKITAKYDRMRQLQDDKEESGALISMRAAFKQGMKTKRGKQEVILPMPPAGAKGGALVRSETKWKMPSPKQLKKMAMTKTIQYMTQLAKRDQSSAEVVKAIEHKLEGTTIKITTSKHLFSESMMTPRIVLVGTLGTIYGKIHALPLVGKTMSQTFTGKKSIGDIVRVELHAPKGKKRDSDPWLCTGFEVQVGYGNPWVKLTRSGFPGSYKFWLDRKPFNNGPYYGLPRRDFWVLRAAGSAKPAFQKKFVKRWPHCHNINCMYGPLSKLKKACAKNHRCNGFTYTTGVTKHGNGCLKMKCGKNGMGANGWGHKTHDYYELFSTYWKKVLQKRKEKKIEKKKKELHVKEKAKKEKTKKAEMKHKEKEMKAREKANKAAKRKEASQKAKARADELRAKEKQSKEGKSKENKRKKQEMNNKERGSKVERSNKERAYKSQFLRPGQCCWFLWGCKDCCDKCPHGNHHVWPRTCGTSRRCNRL